LPQNWVGKALTPKSPKDLEGTPLGGEEVEIIFPPLKNPFLIGGKNLP